MDGDRAVQSSTGWLAAGQLRLASWPATLQPPLLAHEPDLLGLAAEEVAAAGVAGERRLVKTLYLAVTSRLLDRPCSVAVKGPSAGGKSFLVDQVLRLFPADAYYALSA